MNNIEILTLIIWLIFSIISYFLLRCMDRETRSRQYTIGDRLTNIIISIFLGIFICAVALIYYVFSSIIKGIEKLNKPAKW